MSTCEPVSSDEPIVRPRMPELDTIRGIAILAVVFFHGFDDVNKVRKGYPLWQRLFLDATSQGWAGVNLFFVLSGFLITGILLDSLGKPDYFRRFYTNRALRIVPIYYFVLAFLVFWNYLTKEHPPRELWAFAGVSAIYCANLCSLFGVTSYYPLLWSLSVEEHFYMVWPAMIRLLSRKSVVMIAVALCVIEPVLRYNAIATQTAPWWAGPFLGGSFRYTWTASDPLALGALLALLVRSKWGSRSTILRVSLVAWTASALAFAVSLFAPYALALCLRGTLVDYASLALVAGALWLGTGKYKSWANIRWLAFYGYISYGLYLFHGWVFFVLSGVLGKQLPGLLWTVKFDSAVLRFVVCAVAATALAYVSRITYEAYFLGLKSKFGRSAKPKRVATAA